MIRRPERVLFLLPSLRGGGAERVFSVLLQHLDRRSVEPHLALLQVEGSYLQDIPSDVPIHQLNVSRARYALPAIVRLVRRIKPRTVLSTLGQTNIALILSAPLFPRGTRIVLREASFPSLNLADSGHPRLWGKLYRLYRRADKVICLSDSLVDEMAQQFNVPKEKLVRIYNPVDFDRVRKLARCGTSPYSGSGPHLVAAGRLSREKGFDLLLAAMPVVLTRFPQASLTILGQGPLAIDLAAQAQRLGISEAVRLAGFQQNPWLYLKHANVFVLPSRYEGLPCVLLEALALATPVVVTDCSRAIAELRASYPRLVLVPPEAPEALAEAIISVCSAVAAGGYQEDSSLAISKFGIAQIAREYTDILLS
jgi:glycosyltransferase involved in cell wall biosynthesis